MCFNVFKLKHKTKETFSGNNNSTIPEYNCSVRLSSTVSPIRVINQQSVKCNNINMVHQNIQGISGKDLELELFMNSKNIDILCITEHWLKSHQVIFNFNNHRIASSFSRTNLSHGGSLIITRNNIKSKDRTDLVGLSVERVVEIACIEFEHFIVMSVYKPPCAPYDSFQKVMEEALIKISGNHKTIVICGDFNINILEKSTLTINFLNLFKSYDLHNCFLEPTRITASSKTCIDNVFSNVTPNQKLVINLLHSDHCGQLISFSKKKAAPQKTRVNFIPVSVSRLEKFKNNLTQKLPLLPYQNCTEYLYTVLFKLISEEFNNNFTAKTKSISDHLSFSEWATAGIYKSRNRLYELYGEKSYNFDPLFINYVKNYSKTFKRACATAKSIYLKNKIRRSQNKIKETWNIISSETGRAPRRARDVTLNINNIDITDDLKIASEFEKFFTEIPLLTTKTLSSCSTSAEMLLKKNVGKCNVDFEFTTVYYKDIINAFKTIDVKKTMDLWGLSVKTVSGIIDVIAPYLAIVFNSCVASGVFPDLMKHSKVIPLFKSGDASDPTNFRPISILPTLSKVFEKLMLNQLLVHFERHSLLHKNQFGFTKGRSTTDAGVELLKNIYTAWENSQDALGVFCDLSKAFDCVNHDTLVRKLHHYGVRSKASELLTSYLSNRIQKVDINGKRSSGARVTMGVPQGSILGPFLFLIYINDLPYFVKESHDTVLFADDTSFIFKLNRQNTNFDEVNNALSKVVDWFNINNLLLNENKTKLIKFCTPNVKRVETKVQINGVALEPVESTIFLGLMLDSKLQWGPHIERLSGKLSSAAYAVKTIRRLTDVDTARIVYFSYFHSIMSYGILLWGNAADINSIFILQKRAVRAIYKLGPRVSLKEKFKEINILTVASQYIFENLMYVRKNVTKFSEKRDIHNVNTRHKHNLVVHSTRLHRISNSFMGQCIRFYNKLPNNIRELPINKFKTFIKTKLYAKGYYKISDYLSDCNAWG